MKRISFFFGLSFYLLFETTDYYEAIAAIFWQFDSYVLVAHHSMKQIFSCGFYASFIVWDRVILNTLIHNCQ